MGSLCPCPHCLCLNSVRDIARWKGNILAMYVLSSYWCFRVILGDVSPGMMDALQGKEMPFVSCCGTSYVLDIGRARRNACKIVAVCVKKAPFVFTKEFPETIFASACLQEAR